MPKQRFKMTVTYEILSDERGVEFTADQMAQTEREKIADQMGYGGNTVWWLDQDTIEVKVKKC